MIKASDLIRLFQQALDEEWGYIWGMRGQVWTQASQNRATREMTVRNGQKWVGRRVADCSGLFVWAFRELGGDIYHGSNTMWKKYTTVKGTLTGDMTIRPGTAVFTVGDDGVRGHVGLYIGSGVCIEAKGTAYGVVTSQLSRWDEWGELVGVEYDLPADVAYIAPRTLRKGNRGTDVEEVQRILNQDTRYDGLKVDGIFGRDTEASVRAFQGDHGLNPDGIVGPKTWEKLREAALPDEDDETAEDKPTTPPVEPPTDPEQDAWDTLSLEEKVENIHKRLLKVEGGESDV